MFYSQFILAKKGPLGTIWIAAHLERKLRKNQVADTDIGVSVDSILFPEMPIALRLSSHLLLGVVRIYSRKVNYLFDDCSEALLKIKQAFRSTAVDLPPEESTAPYHSITLPETFDLDDFELPVNDIFQGNYVDHHISSRDQITLQDTMEGVVYSTSKFGLDERFGDGDASGLDLDEELLVEKEATGGHAVGMNSDVDAQASLQATTHLKHDENQDAATLSEAIPAGVGVDQVEDFDGENEPVEYAQAPCTPGLWEEPNLSTIQETSACDDHQEPENRNVAESAVKENLENACSREAGCFSGEQENDQFEPQEKALREHTSRDYLDSKSFTDSITPDQVGSTSSKAIVSDNIAAASDGPDRVEDLPNGNDGDLENTCPLTAGLESSTNSLGKGSMPCSNFPLLRPCVTHLNSCDTCENSASPDAEVLHLLEASERKEAPSASGDSILVQGEGPDASNHLEQNLVGSHVTQQVSHGEIQEAVNITNEEGDNVIPVEFEVENINRDPSDFPDPEKLLSVPEGLSYVSKDLLLETTPFQENMTRDDGGDAGSDMLTGKKRSFTESSLTVQSLNLDESSGLLTSKITAGCLPDDDDLLSSILVGRSSVLKLKPTPSLEKPSAKRRRSAPRTGISKRKVLMDDNMVLHGDTIRQQLINTEDIRRLRKKAPCTRPEISMIQKQLWEDELFGEAIFTGMQMDLASLHNQPYDLRRIRISENDENGMQVEAETENVDVSVRPNVPEENAGETNIEPVAGKDICEPISTPLTDNQQCEIYRMDSDHHGNEAHIHITGGIEHELLGQRAAMEIGGKTSLDAAIEPSTCATDAVASDACDMSALVGQVEKTSETDASKQMDAPAVQSDGKADLLSVEMDPSMDISSNKTETGIGAEITVDIAIGEEISEEKHEHVVEGVEDDNSVKILTDTTDCFEHRKDANVFATISSEADDLRPHSVTVDQDMEEIRRIDEGLLNEDSVLDPGVECNTKNLVPNGICGEEIAIVAAYDGEVGFHMKDVSLDDGGNPDNVDACPATAKDVDNISADDKIDGDELGYSTFGNDTDFLNFDDDDDDAEAAGDCRPDSEATRFIDNSGWSSRTKAVAKYLQIMFDKEAERGRKVLPMNNLLAGKTRKEASRMFFETLVLKTKDYIHVEQGDPFANINILPQVKLLKSDF